MGIGFWGHFTLSCLYSRGVGGQGDWSVSLWGKTSKFEDYGRKKPKQDRGGLWRANLRKEFLGLEAKKPCQSYSLRKQGLIISVNICCKYRELVISSLMTIYLVFCKSKAKYHMLCRPLIRQAPGKQQRLPDLRERRGVPGGLWASVTPFIKVFNL